MRTTIITCYHFNRTRGQDFERLIGTLNASLDQLHGGDNLVLVANESGQVEPPNEVIAALQPHAHVAVDSVTIDTPNGHCGSLNAGIEQALRFSSSGPDDWIGCVQSSATLQPGWLQSARPYMQDQHVGAVFGRIVIEEDPATIWSDGHYVWEGLIRDYNHKIPLRRSMRPSGGLPCLSASFWRRSLVQAIVDKYGDFVCENLPHYGDCADVAHRAKDVHPETQFRYSAGSVVFKRKPDWESEANRTKIACSQLMAAQLYYGYGRRAVDAEGRLVRTFPTAIVKKAHEMATCRLHLRYCAKDAQPPRAGHVIDPAWGEKGGAS